MPFINVPSFLPGVLALLAFSPDTGFSLTKLTDIILHDERPESSLTRGERELIAAYVSQENECTYCTLSHAATAAHYYDDNYELVTTILHNPQEATISEKLRALLNIAKKVQLSGKLVTEEDIARARKAEATDQEIHDTVLIAATFCLYNRYTSGLGAEASIDIKDYIEMGNLLAEVGYSVKFPSTLFNFMKYMVKRLYQVLV